jgi:hypothetical protein
VPLEVNVVLIGFNGDGGYRYPLDGHKLEEFLKTSFPFHRPSCFETGEQIDIERHIMYNVIAVMLCSGYNIFFPNYVVLFLILFWYEIT